MVPWVVKLPKKSKPCLVWLIKPSLGRFDLIGLIRNPSHNNTINVADVTLHTLHTLISFTMVPAWFKILILQHPPKTLPKSSPRPATPAFSKNSSQFPYFYRPKLIPAKRHPPSAKTKTTTPCIPMWSPTIVLTRP
jgi:hypothetical protein